MIYNPEISSLEDREDIDKLIMGELYGILIAYEMRIGQDNSQKKEATFKASKVSNKSETTIQSKDFDDEETLSQFPHQSVTMIPSIRRLGLLFHLIIPSHPITLVVARHQHGLASWA